MRRGFRWAVGLVALTAVHAQEPVPGGAAPAPASANLADNPGFEERQAGAIHLPAQWDPFSSGEKLLVSLTDSFKRSGARSVRLGAVGLKGAFMGLVQQKAVQPRSRYVFRANLLSDPEAPLGAGCEVLLSLEWHNADGREMGRDESPILTNLSRTQWRELTLIAKPPRGAASVKFTVMLREERQPGRGWVCVDDVEVLAK